MTTKDRSMATGPYPTRAKMRNAVVEGAWCAGRYRTRVTGKVAVIVLSDGSEVECDHTHGHKGNDALVKCANQLVRRLNDAAGIPRADQ